SPPLLPPRSIPVPYTTLFRSVAGDIEGADDVQGAAGDVEGAAGDTPPSLLVLSFSDISRDARVLKQVTMISTDYRVMTCGYGPTDRKSTRLNSSHVSISYAVF